MAWIPERLLNERGKSEWDKFVKIEERNLVDDEDEGDSCCCTPIENRLTPTYSLSLDVVMIDLPASRAETYAFSVPLTSLYSLDVRPPSLSSWCKYSQSLHFTMLDLFVRRLDWH